MYYRRGGSVWWNTSQRKLVRNSSECPGSGRKMPFMFPSISVIDSWRSSKTFFFFFNQQSKIWTAGFEKNIWFLKACRRWHKNVSLRCRESRYHDDDLVFTSVLSFIPLPKCWEDLKDFVFLWKRTSRSSGLFHCYCSRCRFIQSRPRTQGLTWLVRPLLSCYLDHKITCQDQWGLQTHSLTNLVFSQSS